MKKNVIFLLVFMATFFAVHEVRAERPSFRLLFSNDTTNIMSCPSPFNPEGKPFSEEHLRATVDEAAAADVEMLQPGLGWIPWWKSKILPMEEHVRWLESVGSKPNSFDRFVLGGGDMVEIFIDQCRKKKVTAFVSLRMNDIHHVYRGNAEVDPAKRLQKMTEFQYFADHQDLLLGPGADDNRIAEFIFDFGRKEIRDYKMQFLRELTENYDVDGLELDFMRQQILFHQKNTTSGQRREIMTAFLREVRALLDRTARDGRRRWLCVRVPSLVQQWDAMGFDPKAWAEAGVDMFNVSSSYFTDFQIDLKKLRAELPETAAFYPELHFAIAFHSQLPPPNPNSRARPAVYCRTTERQFYTAAHMAYARGAGGVSLFNFHYYRGTRNPTDVHGKSVEPPFHIFPKLRDPDWLATQPQHYVVANSWYSRPLEKPFQVNAAPQTLRLDMAPPKGGWKKDGRLRIQANQSLGQSQWTVVLNGVKLDRTDDVSEPYDNPYPEGRGVPEDFRAWKVPANILKDGDNTIELSLDAATEPTRIFYLDIAVE